MADKGRKKERIIELKWQKQKKERITGLVKDLTYLLIILDTRKGTLDKET